MKPVAQILESERGGALLFFECPGCRYGHGVNVRVPEGSKAPLWKWNGSLEAPTVEPSIMVNASKRGDYPLCHSFVREGKIEFLPDCTHSLAGQTLPLQPI